MGPESAKTDSAGWTVFGSDVGSVRRIPIGREAVLENKSGREHDLVSGLSCESTLPNVPGRFPDVGVRVHER